MLVPQSLPILYLCLKGKMSLSKSKIKKYRPSNGTEGECFYYEFCFKCQKHLSCRIPEKTQDYLVDHPKYPSAWQYKNDIPVCIKFKRKKEWS